MKLLLFRQQSFALTESSALRPSKQHEAPATCIVDCEYQKIIHFVRLSHDTIAHELL